MRTLIIASVILFTGTTQAKPIDKAHKILDNFEPTYDQPSQVSTWRAVHREGFTRQRDNIRWRRVKKKINRILSQEDPRSLEVRLVRHRLHKARP